MIFHGAGLGTGAKLEPNGGGALSIDLLLVLLFIW